jgi:HK97 gp10 family phage protein
MADVEIRTNLPELKSRLDRFGAKMAGIVGYATRQSGLIFVRAARALAPSLQEKNKRKDRVPGTLKRNIFVAKSKRDKRKGIAHYIVGVRAFEKGAKSSIKRGDAFYWRFLEYGWMPRGPGRRLRGGERSRQYHRAKNKSYGAVTVKYPFLGPAFKTARENALRKFFDAADARIIAAAKEAK